MQGLDFELLLSDKEFASQLMNNERRIGTFSKKAVNELGSIEQQFKQLAQVASGAFAFNELKNLGSQLVQVRGDFQQLEIAFETMLGSKAKADKLFGEVVQLAASTPFGLKDAASATKQLLAYGYASETVVAELRQLGDIAAGVGAPIGDLAYLMGTLKTQGRAMTVDINQLAGRGIPIWEELSKVMKVNVTDLRAFVEAGKVGYSDVQQVVRNLTNEGGMFAGLMDKQSKSLTGLMSSLGDAVDVMFNQIGESQQGALASSIGFATSIVQNYEPILDTLKVIIAAYGSYRAAIMLTAAVQSAATAANVIEGYIALAKHVGIATAAQKAFNGAALANPYAIAAAALIGLVTAIVAFNKEISEADKLQGEYNSKLDQSARTDELRRVKVEELRKAIKDESLSQEERKKKLDELIALSPQHLKSLTLANIATEYATQLILDYNKAMAAKNAADTRDAQIMANQAKLAAIRSGAVDKQFGPTAAQRTAFYQAAAGSQGQFDVERETKLLIERNRQEAIQALTDQTKKLLTEDGRGIEQRRKQRREAYKEELNDVQKSVADYDKLLEQLRDNQKKSTSLEGFKAIEKQISEVETKRRQITGELTREQKQMAKDADKIGPYGSISYWEEIARRADEIISKTPSSNTARLTAQSKIKAEADQRAEDIRQQYAVKSFQQELDSKKQAYELYNAWATEYSKEAADMQFKELVSGNKSYLDYLNAEILKLQPFANSAPLNPSDTTKLGILTNERKRVTGEDTDMEAFNEEIKKATDSALTLTQQLVKLEEVQRQIGRPQTETDFTKIKQISGLKTSLNTQLDQALAEFIQQVNANGAKVLAVENKYADLKNQAQKRYNGQQLKLALDNIEKRKTAELEGIKDEEFEQSEAYKRIHKEYLDYGRKEIKERLANIQTALQQENLSVEKRKQLEFQLAQVRRDLNKNTSDSLREAATLLSNAFGDTSIKFSKNLDISVKKLASVINSVANLTDSSATKMSKVSSIVDIFSFLTVSVRDALMTSKDLATGMEPQKEAYQAIAAEIEGINILLERQKYLLDDLKGDAKTSGMLDLLDQATKEQQAALQALKDLQVDVIKSQREVFVDPVWGTEVENKGLKALYANIVTLGQAKTKIKYELETVDTTGLNTIEDFIQLRADIAKNGGKIDGKVVAEDDVKALDALIARYETAEKLQKELEEQIATFLTGTTEDAIVDSIVDGFASGKSAAADFADTFEAMMRNAILNGIKADMLNGQLDAFYAKLKKYAADGLDQGEIDELRKDYADYIKESKRNYDAAEQVTGIDLSNNQGKGPNAQQGWVTGVTEETAGKLEGTFNAVRILQAEHVNVARSQLFELTAIKVNTSNVEMNTRQLFAIREDMAEIRRLLGADFLRAIGGL